MIHRVYNQAKHAANLHEVVIATDDERIADAVRSFAGNVVMTSKDHVSGTDRCAEVISQVTGFDVVVNIQGDEPFINPLQIDLLTACFQDKGTLIATLVKTISTEEELFNTNKPKVVVDRNNKALYFSRQTIPFQKATPTAEWYEALPYYAHIGIYGYTVDTLKEITQLPPSLLELAEGLEQLRWLENGYSITTALSNHDNDAVDTPEDLKHILKKYFAS